MKGLFLRVYLAVALAITVVTIGVYAFLHGTFTPNRNELVREQVEEAALGMARALSEAPAASDRRMTLVRELQQETGPTLAILPIGMTPLSAEQQGQLRRGRVVLVGSELRRFAYALIPGEDSVLEWELLGLQSLALQWVSPTLELEASSKLGRRPATLRRIDADAVELTEIDRQRLVYRPISVPDIGHLAAGTLYRSIPGTDQLVQARRPLSDTVLRILIPALCLLLVAVAIGATLVPLHRRLAVVSRVTERFANGDLAARTGLGGRSPVERLGKDIDRMAERISQLLDHNEELLRAVAHELRTPISRLYFSVEVARSAKTIEDLAPLADVVDSSLAELRDLTDELLTFSRSGEGAPALRLEQRDAEALLQTAATQNGDERVRIRSTGGSRPLLSCEPRLMVRAVANVLANAARFANQRIEAGVSIEDERVVFTIDDDGPGIPPSERERVLLPFERLESSRSRDEGGAGLGLALVDRILRRHGGGVQILDSPLGGARVVLWVPVPTDSSGTGSPPKAQA